MKQDKKKLALEKHETFACRLPALALISANQEVGKDYG